MSVAINLNLKSRTLSSLTEQATTENTTSLGFDNFSVVGFQNLQARVGEKLMTRH